MPTCVTISESAPSLQRDDLDERPRADDDARSVDESARVSLERPGKIDDPFAPGSTTAWRSRTGAPPRASAQALPARAPSRCDRRRRTGCRERGRVATPRAAMVEKVMICATRSRPYFDVVDSVARDREVDVHVGQVLARRAQKRSKSRPAHRVDVGDLEAVGGDRACSRSASWPDADAFVREVDKSQTIRSSRRSHL
jgi:hypothetical protein